MKIDEIEVWEAFVGVAKHGNFSKASGALRVAVPQLSKRVAKLEDRLGVRLFQRSTRVVSLTDEGKALLPRVNSILEDLNGVESLFEGQKEISGTVRVTSIPFIAHRFLMPVLGKFMKQHPGIRIELDLSEQVVNLIESNFDIALRIQEPGDSELVYRKLGANDLIFCASPAYLKNSKVPLRRPSDLKHHKLLMLRIHSNCEAKDGSFKLSDFSASQDIVCDNGWFLTELALKDFGVLVRSIWDVRDYLKSGKLVRVLDKHPLETFGQIYAVIPSRRCLAPRVRLFMDFIIAEAVRWSQ